MRIPTATEACILCYQIMVYRRGSAAVADSAVAPFEHCTAAEAAEDVSDADEGVSQDPHSHRSLHLRL